MSYMTPYEKRLLVVNQRNKELHAEKIAKLRAANEKAPYTLLEIQNQREQALIEELKKRDCSYKKTVS